MPDETVREERSVGADDLAPAFEQDDVAPAAARVLAEPPLNADLPESDPLVESETSRVLGEDPREGALIAYGGAGPLFASLLAEELGIETIVIPNYAGNFSAWGLLEQDVVRTAALTIVTGLDEGGIGRAQETLDVTEASLPA